jgi:cell division transport system permease protein
MGTWTGIKRIGRAGFVGFWRNAFVSLAAIFVMTVTLFTIGVAIFLGQLLDTSLEQIRSKVDINVYFVTTATEPDILGLKSSLEGLQDVAEVTYVSREQAYDEFKKRHENDQLTLQALDELGDNPLGATLSIRAKETSQYEGIEAFLKEKRDLEDPEKPFIRETNFYKNKDAIDKLTRIINGVEKFSVVTLSVLIFASVLITFNTIRLAIYTAREEITVMRLVGASNTFIRGPFILQGIMYGTIAGIITLVIFYPLTIWLGGVTESFFLLNIFHYYVQNFPSMFFTIVGAGIVLGAVSSIFAITRYLKA